MSGSVGNCWTWSKENNHLEIAYEIAKKETNKSIQSYDELVAFFKEIPAEKLHWYNFVSYLWYGKEDDFFEVNFAPVIESQYKNARTIPNFSLTHLVCVMCDNKPTFR